MIKRGSNNLGFPETCACNDHLKTNQIQMRGFNLLFKVVKRWSNCQEFLFTKFNQFLLLLYSIEVFVGTGGAIIELHSIMLGCQIKDISTTSQIHIMYLISDFHFQVARDCLFF